MLIDPGICKDAYVYIYIYIIYINVCMYRCVSICITRGPVGSPSLGDVYLEIPTSDGYFFDFGTVTGAPAGSVYGRYTYSS